MIASTIAFEGLPTPANAIFCASFVYAVVAGGKAVELEWVALISVLMSALLVSPIRMFSFAQEFELGCQ